MSLSKKNLLFTVFLILIMFIVLIVISLTVLLASFERIENDRVEQNIGRVENALEEQIEALNLFNIDWSVWDDTYEFIVDRNEDYIISNLVDTTFINRKINIMIFVNNEGEMIWGKAFDISAEGEIPIPEELLKHINTNDPLLALKGPKDFVSGILMTEVGPLIISSQPIVTSEGKGPIRGVLLMGRFLTSGEMEELRETTNFFVELAPLDIGEKEVFVRPKDINDIEGFGLLKDIYGQPAFYLKLTMERTIYKQGLWTLAAFAGFVIFMGTVGSVASLVFNKKSVLHPIEELAKEVREIGLRRDFSLRVNFKEDGEVASLAGNINTMLSTLGTLKVEVDKKNVELSENLKVIEQQNKDLAESKRTVLKLLDQEKELEFQLRGEKASVEKRVEERTYQLKEARDKISEGWLSLQQEKAKLIASINSLSIGFMIVDQEGNVLSHNSAIEKIFGPSSTALWTIKEIQEKLGGSINLVETLRQSTNERKVFEKKDVALGDSGKILRIFAAPIMMMDGVANVIGSVLLFEDVTEAKLLERSKDEFFSIASHELRTPLTAIKGNTALIRDFYPDKMKDAEFAEMINDIRESSERLIQIVNDFLNVSRLEMGKIVFRKEAISVAQIAQETTKELQKVAEDKKLFLTSNIATNLPNVLADKERAKEVLVNLIGNGIAHTQNGGITISGGLQDGLLKIMVSDTGPGIPKENQVLLFRKFQQAGSSIYTRDVTKGTGLGLYISKLIVEGMGGKIWLEASEVGKGSRFAFTLPVAKESSAV